MPTKNAASAWTPVREPASAWTPVPESADASQPAGLGPGEKLPGVNAYPNAGLLAHSPIEPGSFNPLHPIENWHSNVDSRPSDGTAATAVHNLTGRTAQALVAPVVHPLDTIKSLADMGIMGELPGHQNPLVQRLQEFKTEYAKDPALALENVGGDLLGGALGAEVGGVAMRGLGRIGGAAKGAVVGDLDAPLAGRNGVTPRQQYAAAKRVGVDLDAADATGSPVLRGAKAFNENSLTGSHVYEARKTANASALHSAADATLQGMSPLNPEAGGNLIQADLKGNQLELHDSAREAFAELADSTGNRPLESATDPAALAREILDKQNPYTEMFPSLEARKTGNILEDIGQVGLKGKPLPNWGQMQMLRSDLQDVTRNNPDLVQNRTGGQLQRMTGAVDQAMAAGQSGLTPAELETFRNGNEAWRDMKETYDDPTNPLYHAVRTGSPSSLVEGIGAKTPENLRDFKGRVSNEAVGALQRGILEKTLGVTGDDGYNFRTFPKKFASLPDAYVQELYGDSKFPSVNSVATEHGGYTEDAAGRRTYAADVTPTDSYLDRIRDLAQTSQALSRDLNPSGSAKLGQKIAEGSALATAPFGHPLGLAPLLQYPLARLINSTTATDWLMRNQPSPLPSLAVPAGVVLGAAGPLRDRRMEKR